jgi:branched-chain amino acid transport system ATP-binding protein
MSIDPGRQETPVLELVGIEAGYGKSLVVHDVNITVPPASVVALIGANGAGKTTLLSTASGLIQPVRGAVLVEGVDVTREQPHQRVRRGVCLIPEGRGIFRSLTVKENLELQIPPWIDDPSIDRALEAFPILRDRQHQVAGSLSGGQQQMVALARAYLCEPRVILFDEVSMGLAPMVVDSIFESFTQLSETHTALVIVEQYINRVLDIADFVYMVRRGRISWKGQASDLDSELVMASYLGQESEEDEVLLS